MKIGIAGTGAVGSVFGGLLSQAGHDVVFLARGENLEVMKKSGLEIHGEEHSFIINDTFTNDISMFEDVDLVIISVKSNDTESIALQLKDILNKNALLLTMQNGVDNEEVLSNIFGSDRVLSAATYIQAQSVKPGLVNQQGRIKLLFGALTSNTQHECLQIVKAFKEAGVDTKHVPDIMYHKWKKYLWNVTFNPLSAISLTRVGDILEDQYLHSTAEEVCLEAINVARSIGIDVDVDKTKEQIFKNARFAKDHQTSMLQDRLQNKQMEVDSMSGYVVKKGKELGIETPVLKTIHNLLKYVNG